MCKTSFETPWAKIQNSRVTDLTTDITLLYLSPVNNDIFILLLQVCPMKFTESINIWYVSVRVTCIIKVNIIKTFTGYQGFLKMWWLDYTQKIITWQISYLVREGENICFTISNLVDPGTYVKQGFYEFLQSIMTWYMNLLTLSYPPPYAKRFVT